VQSVNWYIAGSAQQKEAAAVRRQKKKRIKGKARRAGAEQYGENIHKHIYNNEETEQFSAVPHGAGQ